MAVNEVVYNGETLISLTDSTVTPATLLAGVTAYSANGEKITGAYTTPIATTSTLGAVIVGTNISVDSTGKISIANGSTSKKGVLQLTNSISSTSTTTAATPASVKSAYDLAKGKQSPATSLSGYGIEDAYTKSEVDSIKSEVETSATNKVTTHNTSTTAHSDIRNLISELATRLNALANSDDTTLDQMAEVVAYIKSNRGLIEGITTTKANKDYVDEELAKKANTATLAKVATSGSYNDLSNKPTIPSAYTLPNATSSTLGGVKVGTNISVSSGTISVANGSTSAKGVVQLSSSTSSTSTSLAATASAVKSAYDLANGKQSPATTLAGYGITNAYTKTEVDNAINNNKYTLPNATSSTLGGVKVGSNITVSSGTISLSKTNVTNALGYTPPTTNTTYNNATTSTAGLMSASDKAKLDGIAEGANKYTYTLPTASSSTLGGVKTTSTVTSTSGLTACPIIGGVPYYKDTNTTYTLNSFGVTSTANELNYCDGVTSNIQAQLDALAQRIATLEANNNVTLATVATTGSYRDLVDLPTKLNQIKDY